MLVHQLAARSRYCLWLTPAAGLPLAHRRWFEGRRRSVRRRQHSVPCCSRRASPAPEAHLRDPRLRDRTGTARRLQMEPRPKSSSASTGAGTRYPLVRSIPLLAPRQGGFARSHAARIGPSTESCRSREPPLSGSAELTANTTPAADLAPRSFAAGPLMSIGHRQHNLAGCRTTLEKPVCVRGVIERKGAMQVQRQSPRLQPLEDVTRSPEQFVSR